jgi:uncharacterized protein RhaS with RHS repeats
VGTTFNYDELNRLTGASGAYSASYSLNQIGNLLTKVEGSNSYSFTYPSAAPPRPHAHTATGGWSESYDANGNLLQDTLSPNTWEYKHDAENRLVKLSLNGATVARNAYGAEDRLAFRNRVGLDPEGVWMVIWLRSIGRPDPPYFEPGCRRG